MYQVYLEFPEVGGLLLGRYEHFVELHNVLVRDLTHSTEL